MLIWWDSLKTIDSGGDTPVAITGNGEDGEDLLDDIEAILKNELNSYITAIEARKAVQDKTLSPELAQVSDDAYYRQTWNNKILNQTPGILYGIQDINSVPSPAGTAQIFKISVMAVLVDDGQTNDWDKRILRYTRAIKETLEKNFGRLNYISRLTIEAIEPQGFKSEMDSSEEIKVGGVLVTASIY